MSDWREKWREMEGVAREVSLEAAEVLTQHVFFGGKDSVYREECVQVRQQWVAAMLAVVQRSGEGEMSALTSSSTSVASSSSPSSTSVASSSSHLSFLSLLRRMRAAQTVSVAAITQDNARALQQPHLPSDIYRRSLVFERNARDDPVQLAGKAVAAGLSASQVVAALRLMAKAFGANADDVSREFLLRRVAAYFRGETSLLDTVKLLSDWMTDLEGTETPLLRMLLQALKTQLRNTVQSRDLAPNLCRLCQVLMAVSAIQGVDEAFQREMAAIAVSCIVGREMPENPAEMEAMLETLFETIPVETMKRAVGVSLESWMSPAVYSTLLSSVSLERLVSLVAGNDASLQMEGNQEMAGNDASSQMEGNQEMAGNQELEGNDISKQLEGKHTPEENTPNTTHMAKTGPIITMPLLFHAIERRRFDELTFDRTHQLTGASHAVRNVTPRRGMREFQCRLTAALTKTYLQRRQNIDAFFVLLSPLTVSFPRESHVDAGRNAGAGNPPDGGNRRGMAGNPEGRSPIPGNRGNRGTVCWREIDRVLRVFASAGTTRSCDGGAQLGRFFGIREDGGCRCQ